MTPPVTNDLDRVFVRHVNAYKWESMTISCWKYHQVYDSNNHETYCLFKKLSFVLESLYTPVLSQPRLQNGSKVGNKYSQPADRSDCHITRTTHSSDLSQLLYKFLFLAKLPWQHFWNSSTVPFEQASYLLSNALFGISEFNLNWLIFRVIVFSLNSNISKRLIIG